MTTEIDVQSFSWAKAAAKAADWVKTVGLVKAVATFSLISTFFIGVVAKAALKEPPELTEARAAFDAFLDQEVEDNEKIMEDHKNIDIALVERQDTEDGVKGAIAERLKAIRAKIRIKSTGRSLFQTAQQPKPARVKRIQELKEKKKGIWKELKCFDDPTFKGFIPIPQLPEGELTADTFKQVLEERQIRHNQRLEIGACYLEVASGFLQFPVEDLQELNTRMKEQSILISQTANIRR